MDRQLVNYHKLRAGVQTNASPSTPAELRRLEADARDALLSTGLFAEVEVGHTDEVDHLVIALCRYAPQVDEATVARGLELLWQERLRFRLWEAHVTLVDDEHVEFQGATRAGGAGGGGRYVTVHIVAQKARIPFQRAPLN